MQNENCEKDVMVVMLQVHTRVKRNVTALVVFVVPYTPTQKLKETAMDGE
jgi:hypothetical protein